MSEQRRIPELEERKHEFSGDVLEIGSRAGLNLGYYQKGVRGAGLTLNSAM